MQHVQQDEGHCDRHDERADALRSLLAQTGRAVPGGAGIDLTRDLGARNFELSPPGSLLGATLAAEPSCGAVVDATAKGVDYRRANRRCQGQGRVGGRSARRGPPLS
jgi:hypothetical protein